MTRFQTAAVIVAGALAAAGCHDGSPQRMAPKTQKTTKAKSQEVRAVDATQGKASMKDSQAFVINAEDDTPKPVTPEVKQGKGKSPARPIRPTKPAEPPTPPTPEEPTFTAAGDFDSTKEKAKESAIRKAVEKLHDYLREQNPPIKRMPTDEMVRKMLIRHPGASEADVEFGKVTEELVTLPDGNKETRYEVEVAVKVRPQDIRSLRSTDRSSEALWVLAGLGGLAAVIAVFFKIDGWTKGYLTSWLVLGTVGAASLLAGLWWWAK